MNVVDASAFVELLIRSPRGEIVFEELRTGPLAAPHLIDVEVASALRGLAFARVISPSRARQAIEDLRTFPLVRFDHQALLDRIWELRHNLSSYDATYVALAESLNGALLTADKPLAASSGHVAAIRLI